MRDGVGDAERGALERSPLRTLTSQRARTRGASLAPRMRRASRATSSGTGRWRRWSGHRSWTALR